MIQQHTHSQSLATPADSSGSMPLGPSLPSVLILDDDIGVAETVAAMIVSLGGEARVSITAPDFFREWEALNADVAIIDLQMPGRDGLDVMRELGARGRAKVILTSGCDARVLEAARHSARINGLDVVGVLPKPTRRGSLKKILETAQKNGTTAYGPKATAKSDPISVATLHDALENGQIMPYFQPKIRLRDRQLIGFEALARWEHPDLGLVQPDVFIPMTSEHGLERRVTEVMLEQSLSMLVRLGRHDLTMAVNAPMRVCAQPDFADELNQALGNHGLTSANLVLEVTEAGPLEITQGEIDALTRLRMQGFCLSSDDFGTGVSSLERLVRIPFNELKIDRYFARDLGTSPAAEKLVHNLVRIAGAMQMTVTIEGIEDALSLQLSHRLGCDAAQGYHISRPLAEGQVRDWMANVASRSLN